MLKLTYNEQVMEHYEPLKKDHEMTLSLLMLVNEDNYVVSKYQPIINNLDYWTAEQSQKQY